MSFRRRTFPEVLDSLLTGIAGGVAAESHPFPPGENGAPLRHSLQQPRAQQVVSVFGSRDGQPKLFRSGVDYRLLEDGQTLTWLDGAELPDPGTLVYFNYFPESAVPVLTDLSTGSVVRTLAETVGLEVARLSAQLEAVYQSAFLDTAAGSSLDNVVALLGIERVRGGRPQGEVEFRRAPGAAGAVNIPAGTRVLTADGSVEYETTATVTLTPAQNTIRVTARDLEVNAPLAADTLTVLPIPLAGIGAVTNPAPTAITTRDETDGELRERARNFLHGSERATLGALKHAVARQQITADIEELPDQPGFVEITPHVETMTPELQERLLRAIEDARPAGVVVRLKGAEAPRRVDLQLRLTTRTGLPEAALRAAQRAVRARIADYFQRLPAREAGSINQLVGLVLSVPEVQDVRLLKAALSGSAANVANPLTGQIEIAGFPTVLGELSLSDPNLPTLLQGVVRFPAAAPAPAADAIEGALTSALAYLNGLSAAEATPAPLPALTFNRLLHAVPLPGKAGGSLEELDAGGIIPPTAAEVEPYRLTFALSQESGLTQLLEGDGDTYDIAPFERLALGGVELSPEGGDG